MVSVKIVQAKSFDELRKKQTSFNLIHDNTNDLIFLVSVEENGVFRYESVNKSYKKLLGLKPEEVIGKTVNEVWSAQSAEFIKTQFNTLIEAKKGMSYRFFTSSVHGNIEIQSRINPIFDEFGEVINITGVARNLSEIKAKEKDLQETKDQYKILFHSSPDAILIHDDKSVTDVNQAFLHQFGYSERTEIVGKNAFESLVDAESRKIIAQKRSEARSGSPIHIPCIKLLRKDGSFLYSETHIAEIKIKGKSHLQIITRDITDRIRSEQAIKSSQERLQVVANLSHLGGFEWDLEKKELYWEPELNRILDLKEGSNINRIKHFHSVLHPDDREHVIQSFSKAIHHTNTKNLWRVQFRIISHKGKTKHLNSYSTLLRNKAGRVFTIIGACKDITEQIESQKENNRLLDNLKKSEDKFRSLFEDALDPILLLSLTNGFIDCNKATLKLLGLSNKKEMIGKQFEDFSPKFQPDGLLSSQKRQVMNKIGYSNGSNRFEWWLQSAQNMSLSVEVNMVSTTMNEEPVLLVQWRDITMRKESEEALRKSEERLRQIINLVPHFIFAKDVNGKFLLVNKALSKVYNY
jgi:PAS domain S-box-containing protein